MSIVRVLFCFFRNVELIELSNSVKAVQVTFRHQQSHVSPAKGRNRALCVSDAFCRANTFFKILKCHNGRSGHQAATTRIV
jgi:hypothetical protein